MRRPLSMLAALCLLALTAPARAQDAAPPPVPAAPPTLAQALAGLGPPATGVVLAVDAGKVTLLKGADPAAGQATTPGGVAADYGLITQDFGDVTAVAPATMIVLNTAPVAASPFVGLPAETALKLLLSTLTESQWQAVTGEAGLGAGDLTGDDQRALFGDVLPPAPWKVIPEALIGTPKHEGDERDLTADRPQARLRLRLHVGLNLPATDGKDTVFVSSPVGPRAQAEGGHVYHLSMGSGGDAPQIAGVAVRAEVANTPKDGQLDFDRGALQVRVPLAGLHTVGDLVLRAGDLTHTELYADAHYEKRPLTLSGGGAARASDLLRALALCLTATYRQVGPAYVLTDDLRGVGERRQLLTEFDKDVTARRKAALDRAATALAGHSALDLPAADADLALSAAERRQVEADTVYRAAGLVYHKFGFQELSARQQQAVRDAGGADEAGQATLTTGTLLEWLLPTLDGPVISGLPSQFLLPGAHPADAPSAPVAAPPPPSWQGLMRGVPQRALHVSPRTASQADADVAAARALGLNQLWVDAFADGQARQAPLDEAVRAGRAGGVRVFAVLDLLDWGPGAGADAADLTILGETSAQAEARVEDRAAQVAADKGEPPPARGTPGVMVSPFSPGVRQTLRALVSRLAQEPGLAGMVWRATDPAGYTLLPGTVYDDRPALGHTAAARLAFLRQAHIDPLDLPTSQIVLMGTDTSLPLYDGTRYGDALYGPLEAQWRLLRSNADVALLRDLYAAARPDAARPLILAQDRGDHQFEGDGWYGTWDAPNAPPPTFTDPWNTPPEGQPAFSWDTLTQARPQSRSVLTRLPLDEVPTPGDVGDGVRLAVQKIVEQRAKTPQLAWDGFVLDCAGRNGGEDLTPAPVKKPGLSRSPDWAERRSHAPLIVRRPRCPLPAALDARRLRPGRASRRPGGRSPVTGPGARPGRSLP